MLFIEEYLGHVKEFVVVEVEGESHDIYNVKHDDKGIIQKKDLILTMTGHHLIKDTKSNVCQPSDAQFKNYTIFITKK